MHFHFTLLQTTQCIICTYIVLPFDWVNIATLSLRRKLYRGVNWEGSKSHRCFKSLKGEAEPWVHRQVKIISSHSNGGHWQVSDYIWHIGVEGFPISCLKLNIFSDSPVHKPTLGHRRANWEEQIEVGVKDIQVNRF